MEKEKEKEKEKLNDADGRGGEETVNLDAILVHLGHFGRFQKRNYFLISLVVIYSALPLSFVFTTRNSEYRCFIDGCDDPETPIYNTSWLAASIPISKVDSAKQEQCEHFKLKDDVAQYQCEASSFNRSEEVQCDRFVFDNGDATIERDFNVTCDENLWKLTIVGTLNNFGELVFLPLSGYISDRYGRRTMMLIGVLSSTFSALIKSLMTSYGSFLVFEFLETALGCGTYSAAFILAIELVPPERRVLASTFTSCSFALGEALLGLVAWITGSWRLMLQILYIPGILFILYFWIVNESIRWLLSKGNVREAKRILLHCATINRTEIPEDVLNKLGEQKAAEAKNEQKQSVWTVITSSRIAIRLLICSFLWVCNVFVYYGFTLHAVAISGNIYANFIAVTCIEIPAYLVSYFTLNMVGRKKNLSVSLIVAGLSSFAFIFVSDQAHVLRMILFLIGKFSITIAFTTLYIYTTEIFPTTMRHLCLAGCSTFGRIGAIVAPQIPLLAKISPSLPLIMFATMATVSAFLSLTFPETFNKKLPDTIKQAEQIEYETDYV